MVIHPLQEHEVTVSEYLARGTDSGRDYRGPCYEMAMMYLAGHVSSEPELQLVHGTIYMQGVPYAHAWIEIDGGTVFDPMEQRFFTRHGYYQVRQAVPTQVYSPTQAGQLALRTRHCGPWDETTM